MPSSLNSDEGIGQIIRSEILRRTKAQLDTGARKYNSFERAQEALTSLANHIKEDGFFPDAVVAWVSQSGHWNGSEIVGHALSNIFGVPLLLIEITEQGEKRAISRMCDIPSNFKRLLIVDDAGFSGTTMKMFKDTLRKQNKKYILKSAVLGCKSPISQHINYYASTHQFDDIFFPWGWARTVNKFYDLLHSLGAKDRRWLERVVNGAALHTFLVRGLQCNVDILSNVDIAGEALFEFGEQTKFDTMLYITSGNVRIQIDDVKGFFIRNEFIFLPRIVPYTLELSPNASIVRVLI